MREGRTLSAPGLRAYRSGELITGSKSEFLNHFRPDVDVFVAGCIARLTAANEAGAIAQNLNNPEQLDRAVVWTGQLDIVVSTIILAAVALAIATALWAALAPPTSSSSVPLATPTLPVIPALPLSLAAAALSLAGPATSLATRSPRISRALAPSRLLALVRIVRGVGPYLARFRRGALFLIARVCLRTPIIG